MSQKGAGVLVGFLSKRMKFSRFKIGPIPKGVSQNSAGSFEKEMESKKQD